MCERLTLRLPNVEVPLSVSFLTERCWDHTAYLTVGFPKVGSPGNFKVSAEMAKNTSQTAKRDEHFQFVNDQIYLECHTASN